MVGARNAEPLGAAAESLGARGTRVIPVAGDITDAAVRSAGWSALPAIWGASTCS